MPKILMQTNRRTKRAPLRPTLEECDIYCKSKTLEKVQVKRMVELFAKGRPHVTIYGLGRAVTKAVKVALAYQREYPSVCWTISTETVTLQDDIEAEDLDEEAEVQERLNSAIKIIVANTLSS